MEEKGKKSFSDFLRVDVVVVGQKNKSEVVWRGSLNACGSRELPLNVSKEEEKEEERLDGWLWPLATVSENTHPSSGCVSDWSQIFKRAHWHLGLTQPTTLCCCYGVHPPQSTHKRVA
jgi:hypothetical protein